MRIDAWVGTATHLKPCYRLFHNMQSAFGVEKPVAGRWQGANAALASAIGEPPDSDWTRPFLERERVHIFACAEEKEPMYAALEHAMDETQRAETRDREALRRCQFIAQALNAHAEFGVYRQEPRFQDMIKALRERITGAAGTSGYLKVVGIQPA